MGLARKLCETTVGTVLRVILPIALCATQALAAKFTVDSPGDGGDALPGDTFCDDGGGACTFRAALEEANQLAGLDTVWFSVPALTSLTPASELPTIVQPIFVDGTSHSGFSGTPVIELDGSSAGSAHGLKVTAGSSTIRGLAINRFSSYGIWLRGGGNNVVETCYLGTDINGALDQGNGHGIFLSNGSSGNTIGGAGVSGNLISGNTIGVSLVNAFTSAVYGNLIGTDALGTGGLGNSAEGIKVKNSSTNQIGGAGALRNVIADNAIGIQMNGSSTGNVVEGNYIGVDISSSVALANGSYGVFLNNVRDNFVGSGGAGNVISGNTSNGVQITGPNATGNVVEGNTIGLDVTGSIAVGNGLHGVFLTALSNTIGGAGSAGNVISANTIGINLDNATSNAVYGNLIGTDALGTGGFGNAAEGILVKNSSSNQIGGAGALRNVIADNASSGIQMNGSSTANVVEGNYIGVDISSSVALANGGNGVFLNNVSGNFVGNGGAGNVISGNASSGVLISGLTATGNVVEGNTIGLDVTGSIAVGNTGDGIFVENASSSNTIGGAGLAGNVISANTVGINLDNATSNAVYGNLIGTDALGTGGFGNAAEGILVKNSSTNQIGGAGALRNVIADNAIGIQMKRIEYGECG